ncbi:MAG: hypothetical protein AAGJ70_04675 [Pseudomonadota bacterium]
MNWSVVFAPYLPWPALIALGVLALAIVGLFAWQRRAGTVLRLVGLAAVLGALANPTLKQEERQFLSNIAVVVVDVSASQSIADRRAQSAAARAAVEAQLKGIKNLEVRVVEAAATQDDGKAGTQLFAELETTLADIPSDRLAGILMVTDGQVHDVPKNIGAIDKSVPIHALLTGRPGEFDRRIRVVKAPRYGIVGSQTEVRLKVEVQGRGSGAAGSRAARLRVRREGKPDERIVAQPGEEIVVDFDFPHAGTNLIELDLEPVPGELTTANNRTIITAQGVRENLRVLLVSGEPHAGERTWRNLLKSDAAVDLVHFTILRPPEKQDGTPINQLSLIAFPTRELFSEKLHDFDLVIFDRYQRRGVLPLLYLRNITRYVEDHGGAVLVAAGQDYAEPLSLYLTPLADVLPAAPTGRVIEQPFKPRITATGRRHPVTQGLPGAGEAARAGQTGSATEPSWGRWFRLIEAEQPRGQIVMEGAEDKPLLVLDRRGKGRVALLLSDHAWLWARGLEGGGPHTPLLRRLGHWLMKEPDLEEEYLSAVRKGQTLTIERRTMKDSVSEVEVLGPNGATRSVTLREAEPGIWRGTIDAETPGLYKLTSDELTAVARAGDPNAREMSEVTATRETLAPVIEVSGGGAFWLKTSAAAADGSVMVPKISMLRSAKILHGNSWLALRDRRAFLTRGVKLYPLFTGFAALAALLALIAAMWWREGR